MPPNGAQRRLPLSRSVHGKKQKEKLRDNNFQVALYSGSLFHKVDEGIVLRGHRFMVRVRVPMALREILKRREVRVALGTSNHREALARGIPMVSALKQFFAQMEERVTGQEVAVFCNEFGQDLINNPPAALRAELLQKTSPEQIDLSAARFQKLIDIDQEAIRYGDYSSIEGAVSRFAERRGQVINPASDNYHLLLFNALRVRQGAFMIKRQRALGIHALETEAMVHLSSLCQVAATAPTTPTKPTVPAVKQAKLLSKVAEEFLAEKSDDQVFKDSSKAEVKRSLDNLIFIVGDLPISEVTRETMKEYKKRLKKLPARRTLLKKYKDKDIDELLAMQIPDDQLIEAGTVNNQLTWVTALFSWAEVEEFVESNKAKNLKIPRSVVDDNRQDECLPYTHPEIRDVLHNRTYEKLYPERFWGPLLAPHVGGRSNEIHQLLLSDIVDHAGILCIHITDELPPEKRTRKKSSKSGKRDPDKALKTASSRRIVPVHPLLLEVGFKEYVDQLRASGETRLFPWIVKGERGWGVNPGKWYGRNVTKVLFPDQERLKVFNSFRHSFDDELKNMADIRDSVQLYLMGHATGDLAFDRYGSDQKAPILLDAIKRIDYGLDVEVLKRILANPVKSKRAPQRRKPKK